ncbi:hypothetical protein ACFY4B_42160 [Kitasatospora sp. NPDC001261]|uniref:hypothetical protein n=1 Tax=Kitasatospora sp. NPDC001261 TaxID=3364012 RepID=UPI00367E8849
MPDDIFGDPLPPEQRPARKRQLTDRDQRTRLQRIEDCLDYPMIYELAEHLPAPHQVGCPPQYPPLVYLLLASLMPVTGSKRSAAAHLSSDLLWRRLHTAVRRHAGRLAAARLPDTAPSRGQYLYAEHHLLAPATDLLTDVFEHHAVRQALAQGLFPPTAVRTWARPQRRQLIVGDATVPKAPSKAEHPTTLDPATGRLLRHRVDPAARLYYENGETRPRPARGTKWFFASGRDDGYWRRVILTYAHVAGGAYEDEAAVAVRSFTTLATRLPGCMGVVYDGALRGVHRDTLARAGLLAINKQHGSVRPMAYELLRFGACRHDLWCDQGRIAERLLLDDGTSVLRPVPVTRLEHRPGRTRSRWYHLLDIPCRRGNHPHRVPVAITTTPADRAVRDTVTGRRARSDTERGFHRAEHLQQIPEPTLAHQHLYPWRADSESVHNQFDQSLWNQRMISYGLDRQKVFVLAFALAHNATSHRIFQNDRIHSRVPSGAGHGPAPAGPGT